MISNLVNTLRKMVLNVNSKLGIIRNTIHDVSKENYIVLYKPFYFIVVLLGHLTILFFTKKLKNPKKSYQIGYHIVID